MQLLESFAVYWRMEWKHTWTSLKSKMNVQRWITALRSQWDLSVIHGLWEPFLFLTNWNQIMFLCMKPWNIWMFMKLFLYNIQPDDSLDRRHCLQKLTLPYPNKLYSHAFGNYSGNFNFVWKILIYEDSAKVDLEAVGCIQNDIPVFWTRAMRRQ